MLTRIMTKTIINNIGIGKIQIILGSRQCGKTTILKNIAKELNLKTLFWNGDEPDIRQILPTATSTQLKEMIGNNELLIIDEAQRIDNIGLVLKLVQDNIGNLKVLVSGSSSFELANKINEPLTGRKIEYNLFPISCTEMINNSSVLEEKRLLEQRLIYGSYPEVITNSANSKEILMQLANSYLYKDILTWERIQKPERLERLLQALAFQLGSEVSYNELGQICGLDKETVEKYIQLLEKSFIVFRLISFSRNIRNELKKSRKIYFFDNGIRNAVVKSFNTIAFRNDIGALWENYLISERIKTLSYSRKYVNAFFWRTAQQQEIDYIEDFDAVLHAYEFKWSGKKIPKIPKTFANAYPEHVYNVITPENYINWLE